MREKIRDKDRLIHILQSIENIETFIGEKTRDQFFNDPVLYHAVINNLAIMGEATYKLTKDFIEINKEIPWRDIIHMRHFLIHGYYQIDKGIVWETVKKDLHPLKEWIIVYLNKNK